jgi:hypothetical protein
MNDDLDQAQTLDNDHEDIEGASEPRAKSLEETVRESYDKVRQKAQDKAEARKETVESKPARERNEQGRFARQDKEDAPSVKETVADPTEQAPQVENKPMRRPPPGFSPQSKHYYDNLPDFVKEDIAKREEEVSKGFAEHLPKIEKYKAVEKYVEMAEKSGTTLDKALDKYVGLENLLRRDAFQGIEQVLQNMGINPIHFAQAYLNRASAGDQKPQTSSPPFADQKATGWGSGTDQKVWDPQSIIQQATAAVRQELEEKRVQEEISRLANDPKYRFFENVRPRMAQLVQAGLAVGFDDAYDKACKLDPEISQLLNGQQNQGNSKRDAVDRARSAAKATLGARSAQPAPGLQIKKGDSLRSTVRAAFAAQKEQRA